MQSENTTFEKLIIDYLSGNISDTDEPILLNLLKSDEKYREQLRELAKTRAISFVPILEKAKQSNYNQLKKQLILSGTKKPVFISQFLRIAAIFVLALTTGVSAYFLYSKFINAQDQLMISQTIVPLGSQSKIVLPDGSVVWLNSGSEFKYDNTFGKKERRVTLVGEAYFEVTKDKTKPFLVTTDNLEIKVLGTTFNVNSYLENETVKVDLLEGKVDVTTTNDELTDKRTLMPNEMIVYNKKSKKMTKGTSDAAKSAQWKTGKLSFENESMENILHNLERKFDVRFVIESKKIKSEIFSGSLNLNQSLNEILDYIDVDKKFERIYDGRNVHIKDRIKK
ncbi:MAG TPA: FecR domain-containing protein [Paludibacter sp.]|nr:FecR domain-containing protein [Paludibacter sp.]